MKYKILIITSLLFIFSACKKQVDKDRTEFIGKWHACVGGSGGCEYFATLTVNDNSEASYYIYYEGHDNTYEGIARANEKHFKIGRTKYFDIVEYPHPIDTAIEKKSVTDINGVTRLANWKMVLDGMKPSSLYVSGKREYYKADY